MNIITSKEDAAVLLVTLVKMEEAVCKNFKRRNAIKKRISLIKTYKSIKESVAKSIDQCANIGIGFVNLDFESDQVEMLQEFTLHMKELLEKEGEENEAYKSFRKLSYVINLESEKQVVNV